MSLRGYHLASGPTVLGAPSNSYVSQYPIVRRRHTPLLGAGSKRGALPHSCTLFARPHRAPITHSTLTPFGLHPRPPSPPESLPHHFPLPRLSTSNYLCHSILPLLLHIISQRFHSAPMTVCQTLHHNSSAQRFTPAHFEEALLTPDPLHITTTYCDTIVHRTSPPMTNLATHYQLPASHTFNTIIATSSTLLAHQPSHAFTRHHYPHRMLYT